MCGICGIWGSPDIEATKAMVGAMRHRGPDDCGVYYDNKITLGMSRLAVIDLSSAAHQPMSTPDGRIWIVYNGETYNFKAEREKLKSMGYDFRSSSDTEAVLRMYEHYGDDFLLRLRGMFALAIYDRREGPGRERLLLARDHVGMKPLLFARVGGRLMFASEIKALLASGLIQPELDPVALRFLLSYGSVYQPRTIVRGIQMLPPAHRMIIRAGGETMERYWSLALNRHPQLQNVPYEESVADLRRTLEDTLRLHMISDVPLGAFLSGGIDSSVLVGLMTNAIGQKVKTFSVGFGREGIDIDESDDAERTARHLGTDHHFVMVRDTDVRDHIGHIAYSLDQPSVDGVNSYFVARAAREQLTVAISGTGGDELYAGYPWFMAMRPPRDDKNGWNSIGRSIVGRIAMSPAFDLLMTTRMGFRLQKMRDVANFLSHYSGQYQIFGALGTARLLSPKLRRSAQAGRAACHDLVSIDELSAAGTIERVTGLCMRGYTHNQLLRDIDAVSMGHSLEVRIPYLDRNVIDHALSLPASAKLHEQLTASESTSTHYHHTGAKRILIDAARKLLPEGFDHRPKRGFSMPFDSWLRGPLNEVLMDSLADHRVRTRGLFDVKEVASVKDKFFQNQCGWAQPWLLMMLELWMQEVLERPASSLADYSHDQTGVFSNIPTVAG